MFAIAFDLIVEETQVRHPKSVPAAYTEIARVLRRYGFEGIQGSVYVTNNEDLANLMRAIDALKSLPWFAQSVRDIRAFRVDMWSDFTDFVKQQ
jgi:virulence-associated protein VapD